MHEPLAGLPRRATAALWLTLCLGMVGFGVVLPVLPLYAAALGATPATIAALAASFSLAQLLAAPLLGRLGDRVGRRRVLLVSVAGACAAMTLLAVAESLWLLFAARLLAGSCGANMASAQAYAAERVAPEQRARVLGILGSALGVGLVLGPALGGLLMSPERPGLPFAAAALVGAINLVLAYRWLPDGPPAARSRPTPTITAAIRELGGAGGRLLGTNLGFYAAFAAMESTFALLLAVRLGYGAWEAGLLYALIGVVSVVAQGGVVGRVVARFGEAGALRLGLTLLAAGLLAIGVGWRAPMIAVGAVIVALANGLVAPALNALICGRAAPGEQGLQLGFAASAGSLGRVLGPLAAGVVFEAVGPGAPAAMAAALVVALALFVHEDGPRGQEVRAR